MKNLLVKIALAGAVLASGIAAASAHPGRGNAAYDRPSGNSGIMTGSSYQNGDNKSNLYALPDSQEERETYNHGA
jgi:hypothetical protein